MEILDETFELEGGFRNRFSNNNFLFYIKLHVIVNLFKVNLFYSGNKYFKNMYNLQHQRSKAVAMNLNSVV